LFVILNATGVRLEFPPAIIVLTEEVAVAEIRPQLIVERTVASYSISSPVICAISVATPSIGSGALPACTLYFVGTCLKLFTIPAPRLVHAVDKAVVPYGATSILQLPIIRFATLTLEF